MSTKASKEHKRTKEKEASQKHISYDEVSSLSSEDEDGLDVSEEGLAKLMTALGDDGLDDVAQQMLEDLRGEEMDESEGDGDAEEELEVKARGDADSDDSESDNGSEHSGAGEGEFIDDKKISDGDDAAVEMDEVSSIDEDAVPRQKVVIDNREALERIRESIKLDQSLPWTKTLTITYPSMHTVDVDNDLDREVSFYKQALHSAEAARTLAASYSLPFTRPPDYFAEMVKSDAHMERVRQRLLDESAGIKKSEEKKRERENKKFGKQLQVEKLRERERSRKELDDKIKGLKRKRKGGALDDMQGEEFDVALEDAITDQPNKRPRMPRRIRDEKYGHGGRGSVGWRSKQNTRESTDKFEFGGRGRGPRGRGGSKMGSRGGAHGTRIGKSTKRLGKSRRLASRSK